MMSLIGESLDLRFYFLSRATLKAGTVEWWNGGMAEWWNGGMAE